MSNYPDGMTWADFDRAMGDDDEPVCICGNECDWAGGCGCDDNCAECLDGCEACNVQEPDYQAMVEDERERAADAAEYYYP